MGSSTHLLVQTAFIGDLFLSLPLMTQIRRRFPNHKLQLVCRKGLGDVMKASGLVDKVYELDKSDRASFRRLRQELKSIEFDTVFCPHQSMRSAVLVWGLRARCKIGFYRPWNFWAFDRRLPRPMQWPDALRQLFLLTVADEKFADEFAALNPQLQNPSKASETHSFAGVDIPEWAQMRWPQKLPASPEAIRPVYLAPGSVWPTKRWTEQGFVDVAAALVNQGTPVILTGSPQERELCQRIADQVPGVFNLAGQTSLVETVQKLAQGQALVTNDSGAMHMATAADIPIVAIFGPTTLELGYRPFTEKSVVVQKDLHCRPCGIHGHKKCPIGTHECMTNIKAEEVLQALRQVT